MIIRITSGAPGVTVGIGQAVGQVAEGPLALLLVGDYGTGKTTFVKGFAKGLGVTEVVRSPSFNILKRYSTGRTVLVHADLYRTKSDPDIEELGLLDIVTARGILAIEWPGRYLPPPQEMPAVAITFSYPPGASRDKAETEQRNLEFSWDDDCPGRIPEVLRAIAAR